MGGDDAVRRQAVFPWTYTAVPPEFELVPLDGATVAFSPWPIAQIVRVDGAGPADVGAVVEAVRSLAREREKRVVAWWVAPEHDRLVGELESCGLVNEDTPGFEAVENAMVLTAPPRRVDDGIEVRVRETWEDFLAAHEVSREAFGTPDTPEEALREQFERQRGRGDDAGRSYIAFIDGRAVGSGVAVPGEAGVNLFAGAVVESARGRGVYRALVAARWDWAVERGTPALTVQAGRQSRPILERLGFEFVAPVRVFVDSL